MRFSMYSQLMDPTGNRVYADLLDELKEQTALCEQARLSLCVGRRASFLGGENCSTNPTVTGSMLAGIRNTSVSDRPMWPVVGNPYAWRKTLRCWTT